MSLSLDELNAELAAVEDEYEILDISEAIEVEEEEEFDPDEALARAYDLLDDAMRMLGFYGDPRLTRTVNLRDQQMMMEMAEELNEFLIEVGQIE